MKTTAIVVDDEVVMLDFVERVLRPHFSVLTFSSVEEALPSLERAEVIVSDFQMPGLGGAGLIEHLEKNRSVPLLIISGLGPDAPELACARDREIPILGKPFTPNELLHAVKELLS